MPDVDQQPLLNAWRQFYAKQLPPPAEHNCDLPEFWAVMELDDLATHNPEAAWPLILELLEHALPDNAFGALAAGPLEDLIEYQGPTFIERIELEARRNPKFRSLLGGVWESSTPQVWERVEKVRGERW
jgi:hypothetical protein